MNNDSIYPSISILGSTGSVGQQAIEVAMQNGIRVNCISANRNVDLVERQARALCVRACAMADRDAARELKRRLFGTDIDVYVGTDGICEMVSLFIKLHNHKETFFCFRNIYYHAFSGF